jgi:hypothetical protein
MARYGAPVHRVDRIQHDSVLVGCLSGVGFSLTRFSAVHARLPGREGQ